MSAPKFVYWRLNGAGQERFLNAHTTSNFSAASQHATALLNGAGRVIACAFIVIAPDQQSSLWVLEESTVALVQQHLSLATRFARLSWAQELCGPLGLDLMIPWIQKRSSLLFTAHDMSLDLLGIVDFNKGCYMGQEIVARVHARVVEHKRRLFWISTDFDENQSHFLYCLRKNVLSVVDLVPSQSTSLEKENYLIRQVQADDKGLCF